MALNRRERTLLAAPLLLVAAIGFYTYVHQPLFTALGRAHTDLASTHAQWLRDEARLKKEGDLNNRETRLQQRLSALEQQVGGRRSATVLIYHLARAEQESGIRVRAVSFSVGQADAGLLPVTIALETDGSFLSHVLFAQATEHIPVFVAGDHVELTRDYNTVTAAVNRSTKPGAPSASTLAQLAYAPPVTATYRFILYVRPAADSPDTAGLLFTDAVGRSDPFAESAAAALNAELQLAFPGAKLQVPTSPSQPPAAPVPSPQTPATTDRRPASQLG